jgi:hypothetical protein
MFWQLIGDLLKGLKGQDSGDGDANRKFKRKIIYASPPKGELLSAKGRLCFVTLWDVSKGGVCVLAGTKLTKLESTDELLTLLFNKSSATQKIEFTVKIKWEKVDSGGTYIGLQYRGPVLPPKEFLDKYCPLE